MQPASHHRHPPFKTLAIAALAFGLVAASCDMPIARSTPRPSRLVSTPEPRPTATSTEIDEGPTPRPAPSGGLDLIGAANALADLDSYRVTVASRGLVPATTSSGQVTMTSTLVQGADPAAAFTMTGVDGYEGGRLQAIVIGEEAWVRNGSGGWSKSPGGAADFDAAFTTLSPIDLVTDFEGLAGALAQVGPQRKNGQQATLYRSTDGDEQAIAAGLSHGTMDLWLAADGGYLVALGIAGTWDVDGAPTLVNLTIDVTRVNDPANRVAPPA
jgi:hypothetical protein